MKLAEASFVFVDTLRLFVLRSPAVEFGLVAVAGVVVEMGGRSVSNSSRRHHHHSHRSTDFIFFLFIIV